MRIFEIFNTKANVRWSYRNGKYFGRFDNGVGEFGINIEELDWNKFEIPEMLDKLKKYKAISVIFGNIVDGDIYINPFKNKQKFATFGTVRNVLIEFVNDNNVDIVIFAAKKDVGYESRKSLYSVISSSVCKQFGWLPIEADDTSGTYYVLFRKKVELSEKDQENIRKMMIDDVKNKFGKLK